MTINTALSITHPDKTPAVIADEQIRCYQLRLMGHSIRRISELLAAEGISLSPATVHRRVTAEIKSRVEPLVEEYIAMELDKLDVMETYLQPRVESGDDKAVNARLRIMERRAKLLGLDAPERLDMRLSAADTEINQWMPPTEDAPDDPDVIEGVVVDE